MDKNYQIHRLANGMRLIHRQVKTTKLAHCGVVLNVGSRDETLEQQGIAHFWEHMAFKGTNKRKTYHILNSIDSVGGELNAYTSKEKITFYTSTLVEHFEKSVDILSDLTFNSNFPEKEIEKERSVILEEMSMYKDDPTDAIGDEFDEIIFPNHPLGRNILGTVDSVNSFQQKDFFDFLEQNVDTHQVVISSISNLPFEKVVKLVEKYFGGVKEAKKDRKREIFTGYKPQFIEKYKPINSAHVMIGSDAFEMHHPKRLTFFLLTNLLGGPAMNSRLNLGIREKYGYVYDISAGSTSYLDSGQFSIYFATEDKSLNKCLKLVHGELSKLREKKLGVQQLRSVKQQIMGQIAMSGESNLSIMLGMGKALLDKEKFETIEEVFQQIKAISAEDLLEVANEMFAEERMSTLIYHPKLKSQA
ncbi:M16 family metallopeptidase [Flammeovirga aprica]|uniref:Insulinase family protein n=1 Tax=Flammeovirga aprica JL-4 TaxID=694437 RepID=A0A7X9RYR7_9BACT|nr:pitrilysin family protein [Flammeovirga aprica]NME71107.1 insulinase family protein [Flammeovirga aprica JL-4]